MTASSSDSASELVTQSTHHGSAQDLVVAYNFPPFVDASAVTVAKRVVERGRPVDVVSQDLSKIRRSDSSLDALVAPYVRRRIAVPGTPVFAQWPGIRAFVARGAAVVHSWRGGRAYHSVYSRTMWPHSHFLAAYVKAEAPSTRWTAEFSDPLLWHVDGSARTSDAVRADPISRRLFGGLSPAFQRELGASPGVLRAAQLLPFALADELVFTNVQQREVMVGDLGDTELRRQVLARSIVSPHPTPPAEWYAGVPSVHPPRDRISIGYFGTFYANRGLGVMIEALRSLPREQRNRFSVHIFSAGSAAVRAAAERAGIGQLVSAHDELPYLRFLQAAKAFDYLLVQDTQTGGFPVANPFLPSKLSDYKGTGARIFALVAPGSEMAAMSFPAKAVVGDVGSVRSALLRMTESATVDRAEGKGATHAC